MSRYNHITRVPVKLNDAYVRDLISAHLRTLDNLHPEAISIDTTITLVLRSTYHLPFPRTTAEQSVADTA